LRLLAFRRTAAIGAVWVVAMAGLVGTSSSASGQEAVDPGTGSAYAQGLKVDPRNGRLSFGITYGMALAGHQNSVAVGEARSVDLGVIGTTLAADSCTGGDPTLPKEDQPQPLVVRSTDETRERSENENTVEKHAQATEQPFAEAVAVTAAAGEAAVLRIGATTSRTRSGIIDGKRTAIATTDVGDITIGGGAVEIKGLRWRAVYQTAPEELIEGSFTVDGIEAAGEAIPVKDVAEGLTQLNDVLKPLGIVIEAPTIRHEAGIMAVEPLRIGIVPSTERDGVVGPIFNAAQPVRESLFDAIIEADCRTASVITIADIVLGSVSGAGSLNIEVGGVNARSSEIKGTSLLGSLTDFLPPTPAGNLPSSGGGTDLSVGSGSVGGTVTDDAGSDAPADPEPASSEKEESALPAVDSISGSRGGPLVGVGLGGLLLLAALAEADRRKMRQAQRSVPMEVMA
jgi:hypothetical protein